MEQKCLVAGVYRVFDKNGTRSFVGFSMNVEGTLKRLRFELALNACSNKVLQQFYNSCASVSMELIEEVKLSPTMSDLEKEALLKARTYYRRGLLGSNASLIQTEV